MTFCKGMKEFKEQEKIENIFRKSLNKDMMNTMRKRNNIPLANFCHRCIKYNLLEHKICEPCVFLLNNQEPIDRMDDSYQASNYWYSRAG